MQCWHWWSRFQCLHVHYEALGNVQVAFSGVLVRRIDGNLKINNIIVSSHDKIISGWVSDASISRALSVATCQRRLTLSALLCNLSRAI